MAKNKVPTATEVREYLEKEEAYLRDCISNHKSYVVTGPKFPGETIWKSKITIALLEAAEEIGASNEEIWELCKKIAQATHAPVTRKEYLRMEPFAQKEMTVDTVLKLLETYIPPFEDSYRKVFDYVGYYYCLTLISLSDYRKEDCEKQLWTTIDLFFKKDPGLNNISFLLRNMKVLGSQRSVLKDMRECIEKEMSKHSAI